MSTVNDQYTDQEARFARAFAQGATLCVAECNCGRTHFVSARGHGDYEDGELEGLKARAAEDGDKCIEHSEFDSIDICDIENGIIPQCPCGMPQTVADWIDSNARGLTTYLRLYWKDRKKEAERVAKEAAEALNRLSQPPDAEAVT